LSKVQAKQIERLFMAPIQATALSFAAGATAAVTAVLTTLASTAGNGGVAVPVQVSSTTTQGFVVSGVNNRVEIYNSTTKQKMDDNTPAQNEVYGRLTFAASVYTVSLFVLINGVETAYTLPATTTVDLEVVYQFDFDKLPVDALVGLSSRNVDNDAGGGATRIRSERVTVTGANTLAALTVPYAGAGMFLLNVNGQTKTTLGGSPAFTVAGTAITWSAANALFSLATTDTVEAIYAF
jgi:hypothetical protein